MGGGGGGGGRGLDVGKYCRYKYYVIGSINDADIPIWRSEVRFVSSQTLLSSGSLGVPTVCCC